MTKRLQEARGSGAIPMTPFTETDRIDVPVLEKEIEFICRCKSGSICTPMMVSEVFTLSEEERRLMIRVPIEVAAGRTAIIANVSACSIHKAVEYTEYAQRMGADAVVAMGPWAGYCDAEGVRNYFVAIARATTLPVMIQNAALPNVYQSPEQIIALCESEPNISWVKEEAAPGPLSIQNLMAKKTDALEGVMSGFAGMYSVMDYTYGAIATIHACEIADVMQRIWDLLFNHQTEEAYALQSRAVPLLQLEMMHDVTVAKEIMIRRGIFTNRIQRNRARKLTRADIAAVDMAWNAVLPLIEEISGVNAGR